MHVGETCREIKKNSLQLRDAVVTREQTGDKGAQAETRPLMHLGTAIHDQRLPGHKIALGGTEKYDRTH